MSDDDIYDEAEFASLDNLSSGIPSAQTLARSDSPARDQRVVREHIEKMSAGVLR